VPSLSVEESPDGQVLALARNGDTAAFAELVARFQPRVFRWAMTYARDSDEAEDIAQLTFVTIYRQLDQYRGEGPFEAWVFRITRRVAGQGSRNIARWKRLSASPAALPDKDVYVTDPGGRVDKQRVADLVQEFFAGLPARQREVFDLVDLQGYDPSEVAALLDAKPSTVRANLFKARSSIRARILARHPSWAEVARQ
jgi:RNA polymerase sigma-70 factor, ECF subfamily